MYVVSLKLLRLVKCFLRKAILDGIQNILTMQIAIQSAMYDIFSNIFAITSIIIYLDEFSYTLPLEGTVQLIR